MTARLTRYRCKRCGIKRDEWDNEADKDKHTWEIATGREWSDEKLCLISYTIECCHRCGLTKPDTKQYVE